MVYVNAVNAVKDIPSKVTKYSIFFFLDELVTAAIMHSRPPQAGVSPNPTEFAKKIQNFVSTSILN